MQQVAILGASKNPERYSYKALQMLREYGHRVHLVAPALDMVDGVKVVPKLSDIEDRIETLTMYVGPKISSSLKDDILRLNPKRVIFNPGSENLELEQALEAAGIEVQEACTLVLLRTGQF